MPGCTARGVYLAENSVRGSAVENRRSLITRRFWVEIEIHPGIAKEQGFGNSHRVCSMAPILSKERRFSTAELLTLPSPGWHPRRLDWESLKAMCLWVILRPLEGHSHLVKARQLSRSWRSVAFPGTSVLVRHRIPPAAVHRSCSSLGE